MYKKIMFIIIMICIGFNPMNAQKRYKEVIAVIDGDSLYKVLEPDAIPAIRTPKFVTGKNAEKQMSADEPVLGIVHNNEYKAYSLWQLDHHEIVNDFVGNIPIAVTW